MYTTTTTPMETELQAHAESLQRREAQLLQAEQVLSLQVRAWDARLQELQVRLQGCETSLQGWGTSLQDLEARLQELQVRSQGFGACETWFQGLEDEECSI